MLVDSKSAPDHYISDSVYRHWLDSPSLCAFNSAVFGVSHVGFMILEMDTHDWLTNQLVGSLTLISSFSLSLVSLDHFLNSTESSPLSKF